MFKFLTLTTAAIISVGVLAGASLPASAKATSGIHNSVTPAPGLSGTQNSATPAPGMSSVYKGGSQDAIAHMGSQIGNFPHDPTPGPSNGGGNGGGHKLGAGISIDMYQNFDPNGFCRYTMRKHKVVKVCYLAQASYAPSISFGFGF